MPPEVAMLGRLPAALLRLVVSNCVWDRMSCQQTIDALWRESAADVEAIYREVSRKLRDVLADPLEGRHGLLAERMLELQEPLLSRPKRGLTVGEMAECAGVDRETMARALEHHGYLELVPYGGPNRRRLVTRQAERAGLGHNPDGSRRRIGHLEGMAKACVFPVFYPEHLDTILWTLDFEGIRARASAIPKKRERLKWLLDAHGYLPDKAIAFWAGCTDRAVKKARARLRAKVPLQVIEACEGSAFAALGDPGDDQPFDVAERKLADATEEEGCCLSPPPFQHSLRHGADLVPRRAA